MLARRRCPASRRSSAAAFSAASCATKKARATPTWPGSKRRPRASVSARNSATRSPTSASEQNWSISRLWPRAATRRIEPGWPAPCQNGGCGRLHAGRLDDDVLELPEPAAMAEPRVRGPRLGDDVDRFLEPRLGLLHRGCRSRRIRCGGSPCRCRNRAGRRTAGRGSPPARRAARGCATAAPAPPCRAGSCWCAAPIQVSRLRLAETWPKPVKWCSTMKLA